MPGAWNTGVVQGETFAKAVTWKAGSPPVVVNLTGYAAKMQVRDAAGAVVVELSTDNGRAAVSAAGKVTLTLAAADTAGLDAGCHAYDLRLTSPGGVVTVLVAGCFEVKQRVTT